MRKRNYQALTLSLLIHFLIVAVIILTQINTSSKLNKLDDKTKKQKTAIKSFLYRAPKIVKKSTETELKESTKIITEPSKKPKIEQRSKVKVENKALVKKNLPQTLKQPVALPIPKKEAIHQQSIKQINTFTQLQNLRSKLNRSAYQTSQNPDQRYQPPSVFNANAKTVPHSVPIKDEEKERKKNTKNMGSGISTTKGDDGTCSITQDMSVYGLSEGSSTQYFGCGESKMDKSFREHMKKVKAKLGKK